jgi:hypothetical protein
MNECFISKAINVILNSKLRTGNMMQQSEKLHSDFFKLTINVLLYYKLTNAGVLLSAYPLSINNVINIKTGCA